jgi:mRNA-degrading endonuclease RelE of RelBE toxin-antitoxin system
MSKQFKEGSDFEAAAKVLLGESSANELNEKNVRQLKATKILAHPSYTQIETKLNELEKSFSRNSSLYEKLKKSGLSGLRQRFMAMQDGLTTIFVEWEALEKDIKKLDKLDESKTEKINESRVSSSIARDIEQTAESERENGATVEINYGLPYVAVENANGSEYFMQEHEASDFLDEVPDNVNAEDYALWYFNGL